MQSYAPYFPKIKKIRSKKKLIKQHKKNLTTINKNHNHNTNQMVSAHRPRQTKNHTNKTHQHTYNKIKQNTYRNYKNIRYRLNQNMERKPNKIRERYLNKNPQQKITLNYAFNYLLLAQCGDIESNPGPMPNIL